MGTMRGTGDKRNFSGIIFYHFGNSDTKEEALEFADDLRKLNYNVKVTGDRHTGADIWIRQGKKGRFTVAAALRTQNIGILFDRANIEY